VRLAVQDRGVTGGGGKETVPRIDLRVPGPWRSPQELIGRVEKDGGGYRVDEEFLVHDASGARFAWGVSPHDDEIHELFAHDGRLSEEEIDRVASHAVKAHVSGPGGSPDAARAVMAAATALVKAGGYGVMVDNSGNTHGVDDWLALAGDTQPGGLYWAYVSVAGGSDEVWSVGMHCLGFRDAEVCVPNIPDGPGQEDMCFLLHNFLGYCYQSGIPVNDGDPLGDEESALFRVRARPCTRFRTGTPHHNPYGVWLLEPIDEED
jgi:hypothetical protein